MRDSIYDGGKAAAIRNGGKHLQHAFTTELLESARPYLPVGPQALDRMKALIDGDPLGQLLMKPEAFLQLLTAFYQSDASSYTKDAGGLPSLERVFVVEPDGVRLQFDTEKGRLKFNPANEALFAEIQKALS